MVYILVFTQDVTNLDGPSLLVSLRQFMDSYFREREVDFINPRDGFKHIRKCS